MANVAEIPSVMLLATARNDPSTEVTPLTPQSQAVSDWWRKLAIIIPKGKTNLMLYKLRL